MNMRTEQHKPIKIKHIPWFVCVKCGLVYLKNKFTGWCINKGCYYDEHPGYKSARFKFTKIF